MKLFRRISDILSANLNDLVDQFEDPVRMLRQAVRELEEAVERTAQAAVQVVADEKLLARQLELERAQMNAWLKRARLALEQDNDVLARRALRHKAEHEKLAMALEDQHRSANEAAATLRRQLDAMRVKLAEAKRRLTAATAKRQAVDARRQLLNVYGSGNNADWQFCNFAHKLDRFEAETEAYAELSDPRAGELEEFEALEDPDLEQELAALKDAVGRD